jgi:hypothetical protein
MTLAHKKTSDANRPLRPQDKKRQELLRIAESLGDFAGTTLDKLLIKETRSLATPIPGLDLFDLYVARDACLKACGPQTAKEKNSAKYFDLAILEYVLTVRGAKHREILFALSKCKGAAKNAEALDKALRPYRNRVTRMCEELTSGELMEEMKLALFARCTEDARTPLLAILSRPSKPMRRQRYQMNKLRAQKGMVDKQ